MAVSLVLLSAGPVPAATGNSYAGVGSDVTFWLMTKISAHYNATSTDVITEVPPINLAPFPTSVTVPGDSFHGAKTWDSSTAAQTPPNGGSAGVTALGNDTTGDIAFARTTSGPKPGQTDTLNFWAYALSAVDWVSFPHTYAPPAGLTQKQLIDIYTCNPKTGKPIFSNWHSVNSKIPLNPKYRIIKYAPQIGAATRTFFETKLLNGNTIDENCDSADQSITLQVGDARGVTPKNKPAAIYIFDWANYRADGTGFQPDLRNGATLGKFGPTASTRVSPSAKNVNTSPKRFFGTRYVYNVVSTTNHPASDTNQLQGVTAFIGVSQSTGAGWICSGKAAADIKAAGFVSIAKGSTGGIGLPNSYCRLNPTSL